MEKRYEKELLAHEERQVLVYLEERFLFFELAVLFIEFRMDGP